MNILITSVGRRSYLVKYFKDALENKGYVYVSNSTDITPAFSCADGSIVTPLIYSDEYIPFLIDYCKKKSIKAIISLFDVDLYVLSCNRKKFEAIGVKVIVSDADFVKICNDKWLTYNYLLDNGFNVPKTYLSVKNVIDDIKKSIITYPIIIKPRWGMGSLSIYEADNELELKVLYSKIKNEIKNSYIKYESEQDINKSVILQEKIDGQEYGLDVINDLNGNYINTIVRKKIAMRSGETDCAEIVFDKAIIKEGKKLGLLTKHIANLDVDLFCKDDIPYILEMNARFGGGYPFSHLAGVDLPKAIVDWCSNKNIDATLLKPKKSIVGHKDIDIKIININN